MDKRKDYVLLLINAGVRNCKRAQKISAAAPLRVMVSRYNPSSKRAFRVLLLELSLCVYYVINLQFSLLIKFIFGNYVYLYMFRTRIWHRREFYIYFCYSSLVLTTNISVAKFSFVIRLHMVLTGITWITQS